MVRDRSTNREVLVLANTNEDAGMELLFVDFARSAGRAYRAPAGQGAWALNEVSGDRLIVGTYYDGTFMVFDLNKMKFVKAVPFPGESYIWNFEVGSDGRVYGGTYPGGKLGALDLSTYSVEDCGAPAPPNHYLRLVSALPDGRILCYFMFDKWTSIIYDPSTKQFGPMPEKLKGVKGAGVSWGGFYLSGSYAFDAGSLDRVDPYPFPTPPADKGGWGIVPYITTPDMLFYQQGQAIYRLPKGASQASLIADMDLKGGRLIAATSKGNVLGVRGQDYFIISQGDSKLDLKPIPVESSPRPIMFLRTDPNGRLWGGPEFGQTLFYTYPATGKTVNTGAICDAGGEVYDAAFAGGKVYAAAYSGGNIVQYDPQAPWDQFGNVNPKTIASLSAKGYIRPTGGITPGTDGKLYSGWMASYGKYGGAVAITDPATGDTELIENPLGEQAINSVAVAGTRLYVGTNLGANGLPSKTGEPAWFGVIDLTTRKVDFKRDFPDASGIRVLTCGAKSKRVLLAADKALRIFDPVTKGFVDPPPDTPAFTGYSVGITAEGNVVYGSEKSIVEFDMGRCVARKIVDAPRNVVNVAVGPDDMVFCTCGPDLYRVKKGK